MLHWRTCVNESKEVGRQEEDWEIYKLTTRFPGFILMDDSAVGRLRYLYRGRPEEPEGNPPVRPVGSTHGNALAAGLELRVAAAPSREGDQ